VLVKNVVVLITFTDVDLLLVTQMATGQLLADQKSEYRKRAIAMVTETCSAGGIGMLPDLSVFIVDYALNSYFCPLKELPLEIGDLVDVRLKDSRNSVNEHQVGEWVTANIRVRTLDDVIVDVRGKWIDIPMEVGRVQPPGWFTWANSAKFVVGQAVWVWDRWIRQWAHGTVTGEMGMSQWRVQFDRPETKLMRRTEGGTMETVPASRPSIFCAGEIRARIDEIPPFESLHPEDGAVETIR